MKRRPDWSLYLVTDRDLMCGRPLAAVVEAAVRGGVTAVQLREKSCCTRDFVELGRALKTLLGPLGIPLIINDRADVALAVGADGVHIGQQDMDYPAVRRLMGPEAVVGLSVENVQQAFAAEAFDVDYLGVGPIFATPTKSDAAPALGLAGLAEIRAVSRHPIVAIGGVCVANGRRIIEAGAGGVAVVSAICAADDPGQAARDLRLEIEAART